MHMLSTFYLHPQIRNINYLKYYNNLQNNNVKPNKTCLGWSEENIFNLQIHNG